MSENIIYSFLKVLKENILKTFKFKENLEHFKIVLEHFKIVDFLKNLFDNKKCFPVILFLFILVLYFLCFFALFKTKTEIIGFGLFFCLHVLTCFVIFQQLFIHHPTKNINLFVYEDCSNISSASAADSKCKSYFSWFHKTLQEKFLKDKSWLSYFLTFLTFLFSLKSILVICLILMFVSMLILMLVFGKTKQHYTNTSTPITLGDPKNEKLKNELKNIFVIETIFIWVLALFFNLSIFNKDKNPEKKTTYANMFIDGIAFISLVLSIVCITHSDTIARNTNTYYRPNKHPNDMVDLE